MNDPGDIALIEHIARGETDALRALYDRYGRVAFALAYRVIGDASAAEEVVQDVYETVWNKAAGFDVTQGGNVRGWLLTIVHRRAIDYRRREYDRPPRSVPIDSMDQVLSTPDVWQDVSATLLGEQMRDAMSALPADQRRAIELAYFDGLSHGEIALRENMPLGTVKGRLRLGLGKLSAILTNGEDSHESMRGERV